jgi:hypothetical protein
MSNQNVEFSSSSEKPEERQLTIQEKEQLLGGVAFGLVEELARLTDSERQSIHEGRIVEQVIRSASLLAALQNRTPRRSQLIDEIFREFGKRVKYLLSYESYANERRPTYILYIQLAPDEDFIDFDDEEEEVEEEIVEAVAAPPLKAMAAHG